MHVMKRFIISNALGNYLEFFDFTLYSFCAPLIAKLYFPTSDPTISILMVWGVFAVSFAIRPIGAVFWGYIGDHYGRRFALINSIVVMALATMLCGLVPTYTYWGILAPITLLSLRMIQGFSVSAEYNGGSIFIIENSTKNKGLLCSIASFSCGLGIMTASLIMMLLTAGYTADTLPELRWRIPFIVGGLLIGMTGYFLRRSMHTNNDSTSNLAKIKNPLAHLLKNDKTALFRCFCISGYNGVSAYVIYTYFASYLQTHLSINMHDALKFSTIGICISITSALIFGYLSDRLGRKNIMLSATIAMMLLVVPMVSLINTGQSSAIIFGLAGLSICSGAFGGPMNAAVVEMFSTQNRYTGASLGYNLGVTLAGGSAPFIISLLLNKIGNPLVVPIYLMIFASLAMCTLITYRQRSISILTSKVASTS